MVITFSNIKGSTGSGGAASGEISGITLWSDETTKAYIDNALSGVTDAFSAYTKTEDFATINGSAITSGGNLVIEATPYTAGTNIDITNHIISVTGITMPTKVSELVNDKGYITTADTQNFVTSGDVQTQINDSISGKADSSAVTAQISEVKQEIEAEIPTKVSDLQNDLNFASTGDVQTQIDNAVSGKQDTLVSGTNIKTINNQSILGSGNLAIEETSYTAGEGIGINADNIISVTGNYETIVELTQAEYDALTSYGKNTTYVITDAPAVNLSAYTPTSGFSTINGNVITDGGNIVIEDGNTYTAGANINISTDNVISVTGITMPTKLSELTNDEGFVNSGDVKTQVESYNYINSGQAQTQIDNSISGKLNTDIFTTYTASTQTELNNKQDVSGMTEYATTAFTESTYAKIGDIPTKTSDLTNDSGFITDAALSGYATEQYVDNSISGKVDNSALTQYYTSAQTDTAIQNATNGLASEEWVNNQGFLKEHQDISGKLDTSVFTAYTANTQTELNNKQDASAMTAYATTAFTESTYLKEHQSLSAYSTTEQMNQAIGSATAATTGWVESQGYLTEHQSLSAYTPTSGFSTINGSAITSGGNIVVEETPYSGGTNIDITDHIISVTGITVPTSNTAFTNDAGYVTSGEVESQITGKNYATESWAQDKVNLAIESETARTELTYAKIGDIPSLDGYATTGWVESQGYLTEHQDISGKLDSNVFTAYTASTQTELNNKQDASAMTAYYTSAQTNTAIQNATNGLASEEWVESKGYLTAYTESDPVFMASPASGITSQNITNWNAKLDSSDLEPYYTSAQTNNAISNAVSGKADLSAVTAQISEVKAQIETEIPTKVSSLENDLNFVNSGEVETQITNKGYITGYTESDPVFQASAASGISAQDITNWDNKLDSSALNPYYTSAQTDTAISNATSGKQDTLVSGVNIKTINNESLLGSGNIVIQGGSGGGSYTAGNNIDITNDVISVTGLATINGSAITEGGNIEIQGGSGSGSNIIELTQAEYDALTAYTEDAIYVITDSQAINMDNYVTTSALSSYATEQYVDNAVSGKTDKVSVTASSGGYKFPTWNDQGCITGTSATAYQASQSINGSSRTLYSNSSSSLPTIYAPTSAGSAGQPLLSNGSGAPVWGSYKFQFISQSQYDALATKDSTTIYFIVNEN